jgi:hypothetical protein
LSLDYSVSDLVDEHGNAFRYLAAVEAAPGSPVGAFAYDVFLVTPSARTTPAVGGPAGTSDIGIYFKITCTKECDSISWDTHDYCLLPHWRATAIGYPEESEDTALFRAEEKCDQAAMRAYDENGHQTCKARRDELGRVYGWHQCIYDLNDDTPPGCPIP